MTTITDTPLPGAESFVRHQCPDHGEACPPACQHIFTYGPTYRLYESTLGLRRVGELCAARLAELVGVGADDVRVEWLTPEGCPNDVVGLSLILDTDGPLGYHRVSYDPHRRWSYCANPRYSAWDPSCSYPLPDAAPFDVLEDAAEVIAYAARWRGQKCGTVAVGGDPAVGCLRVDAARGIPDPA